MTRTMVSLFSTYTCNPTYIRRQNNRRRRLVQIRDMERLALHAQVHRLQRVQSHLHLWRRLGLLTLLTLHVHLLELIRYTLHALLSWCRIALLRRLVPSLRSTILWLTILLLLLGLLRLTVRWLLWLLGVRVAVLRLLWHTIRRLLSLLTRISIPSLCLLLLLTRVLPTALLLAS